MRPKTPSVILDVDHAEEILTRLYPNGRLGGIRVDGACPAALGSKIDLMVRVREPTPRHINSHMRIAWVRHKGNERLRESFGLDFLPEEEGSRERLLAFARGQVDEPHLRTERRFNVQWPVVVTVNEAVRRETLADVSEGGAFLATTQFLDPGTDVEMLLRPPGALFALKFRAKVVWIRHGGDTPGIGVEFTPDERRQEKLRKLLEKLD